MKEELLSWLPMRANGIYPATGPLKNSVKHTSGLFPWRMERVTFYFLILGLTLLSFALRGSNFLALPGCAYMQTEWSSEFPKIPEAEKPRKSS